MSGVLDAADNGDHIGASNPRSGGDLSHIHHRTRVIGRVGGNYRIGAPIDQIQHARSGHPAGDGVRRRHPNLLPVLTAEESRCIVCCRVIKITGHDIAPVSRGQRCSDDSEDGMYRAHGRHDHPIAGTQEVADRCDSLSYRGVCLYGGGAGTPDSVGPPAHFLQSVHSLFETL